MVLLLSGDKRAKCTYYLTNKTAFRVRHARLVFSTVSFLQTKTYHTAKPATHELDILDNPLIRRWTSLSDTRILLTRHSVCTNKCFHNAEMLRVGELIQSCVVALNARDFDSMFRPEDYSPNFTKHLGPASMHVGPSTLNEWREDLETGFVGQNFREWHSRVDHYWEDIDKLTAIVWCNEQGVLADGQKYEFDYIMRYEFNASGKLEHLFEYNDSSLQRDIFERWTKRLAEEESKKPDGSVQEPGKVEDAFDAPHRLYLITDPRTASNLLLRILSLEEQHGFKVHDMGGYFFMPAIMANNQLHNRGKHIEEWTKEERETMMQIYQTCFEELEKFLQIAQSEKKFAFVKEHSYFMIEPTAQTRYLYGQNSVKESPWTVRVPDSYGKELTRSSLNETVLPDQFLGTMLPTFLIRHPALIFPSHYRTYIDMEGIEAAQTQEAELSLIMTLHWTRTLYEWYTQNQKSPSFLTECSDVIWPLVLDAADVMTKPEVVFRFCSIVKMNTSKLRFNWPAADSNELAQLPNDYERRMRSTLLASSGVLTDKAQANLDIDAEVKKWAVEFGEKDSQRLERWVRAAMPDYEYLRSRRLRLRME